MNWKSPPCPLDGKTYDAFVSYLKECRPENGEEHTFAVETLPGVLEKQFGYKLCIFERDVVPGGGKKGIPDRQLVEIIFYEMVD